MNCRILPARDYFLSLSLARSVRSNCWRGRGLEDRPREGEGGKANRPVLFSSLIEALYLLNFLIGFSSED